MTAQVRVKSGSASGVGAGGGIEVCIHCRGRGDEKGKETRSFGRFFSGSGLRPFFGVADGVADAH